MRNNFEIIDKTNSHNLKHKQKQNDYIVEHERNKCLRSCFKKKTDSQFAQKKNSEMNNCVNEQFHEAKTNHVDD